MNTFYKPLASNSLDQVDANAMINKMTIDTLLPLYKHKPILLIGRRYSFEIQAYLMEGLRNSLKPLRNKDLQ